MVITVFEKVNRNDQSCCRPVTNYKTPAGYSTDGRLRRMNDTHGFSFLINEQPGLATRLIREINSQAREFKSDPKTYIKSSLASDLIGRKRVKLLLVGMTVGSVFLSTLLMV